MAKINFKYIAYDPSLNCWGNGNNAIGLNCVASIQLRKPSKKKPSKKEQQKEYEWLAAKYIYDKYINRGQRFKPCGNKSTNVTAKITFINNDKQSVSWKQDNITTEQLSRGCKPAAGKFSISAMIRLCMVKELEFIN